MKFLPSAKRLPHEDYVAALGDRWSGARLRPCASCLESFFQGHLFYHPANRGNLVKNPIQFYLGLCQRHPSTRCRFPFGHPSPPQPGRRWARPTSTPPNVRGWLYGEQLDSTPPPSGGRRSARQLSLSRSSGKHKHQRATSNAISSGAGKRAGPSFLVSSKRIEASPRGRKRAPYSRAPADLLVTAPLPEIYAKPLERLIRRPPERRPPGFAFRDADHRPPSSPPAYESFLRDGCSFQFSRSPCYSVPFDPAKSVSGFSRLPVSVPATTQPAFRIPPMNSLPSAAGFLRTFRKPRLSSPSAGPLPPSSRVVPSRIRRPRSATRTVLVIIPARPAGTTAWRYIHPFQPTTAINKLRPNLGIRKA